MCTAPTSALMLCVLMVLWASSIPGGSGSAGAICCRQPRSTGIVLRPADWTWSLFTWSSLRKMRLSNPSSCIAVWMPLKANRTTPGAHPSTFTSLFSAKPSLLIGPLPPIFPAPPTSVLNILLTVSRPASTGFSCPSRMKATKSRPIFWSA